MDDGVDDEVDDGVKVVDSGGGRVVVVSFLLFTGVLIVSFLGLGFDFLAPKPLNLVNAPPPVCELKCELKCMLFSSFAILSINREVNRFF